VLVISMLLLLVMTVLALSASQSTRMEERMAGNQRDYDLVFQSAEAGLRAGERVVDDPALTSAPYPCSSAPCTVFQLGTTTATYTYQDQAYQARSWWTTNAHDNDTSQKIGGTGLANADPQYYVEQLEEVTDTLTIPPTGPAPSRMFYRITSRAEGGTQTAQVVLQSTFARRFN